ncbi:unnamed protein product [Ascophyllum nodosum]
MLKISAMGIIAVPVSILNQYPMPKKRRGRWDEAEHEGFLKGIDRHGKEWQVIADLFVPSRTPTQIRTHAQKYEKKLERAMDLPEKTDNPTQGKRCQERSRQPSSPRPEKIRDASARDFSGRDVFSRGIAVVVPTSPCFSADGPISLEEEYYLALTSTGTCGLSASSSEAQGASSSSTPLARRRAFSVEEAAGDNSEGRHVPGDVKGSGDDKEAAH